MNYIQITVSSQNPNISDLVIADLSQIPVESIEVIGDNVHAYMTKDIFDSVFILVLMVGLTLLLIRTKWKISRAEGALLVSINLIRWYFDFAG